MYKGKPHQIDAVFFHRYNRVILNSFQVLIAFIKQMDMRT